jgi:tRNA 2-thiouridine synthesizing protein A
MTVLDLRGLKCPLPALMARRALKRAGPGAAIEVIADDPLAHIDVPHMCRQEGFEVDAVIHDDSCVRMRLSHCLARGPESDPARS